MMQTIDQTFPTEAKIAICILLALCYFVVYFWNPEEKPETKASKQKNAKLDSVDMEAESYSPDTKQMYPEGHVQAFSEGEATLRNLDEYVRSLREHHFDDVDKV